MTTVACSLTEMAADSRVSADGSVARGAMVASKIRVIRDSVFGFSGNISEALIAIAWFEGGRSKFERPSFTSEADFSILELSPSGILLWDPYMSPIHMKDESCAIGTGGPIAQYCMAVLEMSPYQAVIEAAKVDANTGPPFEVLSLPTHSRSRRHDRSTRSKARS